MTLADPTEKPLSKTGVTASVMGGAAGMDMLNAVLQPDGKINWISIVTLVGSILVVLFRRYSDGKSPKIV